MINRRARGSEIDPATLVGREVAAAAIADNKLNIDFADGSKVAVWDDGQSCCEHRYMTTDDDPASLVGGKLIHVTVKDPTNVEADYDAHETAVVEVATDKGFIIIVMHNEHNGYYGGFGLTITPRTE